MLWQFILNHDLDVREFTNFTYFLCEINNANRAHCGMRSNCNPDEVSLFAKQVLSIASTWNSITHYHQFYNFFRLSSWKNNTLTPWASKRTESGNSFVRKASITSYRLDWTSFSCISHMFHCRLFQFFRCLECFHVSLSLKNLNGFHIASNSFLSLKSVSSRNVENLCSTKAA